MTPASEPTKRCVLPNRRETIRQRVKIHGARGPVNLYVDVGFFDQARTEPGEVFVVLQKTGSELRAVLDSLARTISLGLQHGVPLETFVNLYLGTRFEPAGPVEGHEHIKFASSPLDFIARELGIRYCARHELAHTAVQEAVEEGR